jgi:malate/lactate dehydrogenase
MSKIGIVGLGKVGGRLADAILYQTDIEELWLDTRDKEKLLGFLLSFQVASCLVNSRIRVLSLDYNRLNELDLIIICAKENYDPRQLIRADNSHAKWLPKNLRYVGFLNDYPLLKSICNNIKEFRGVVAVVTNPVEINTSLVAGWLPKARVVGLGASIDTSRFIFSLRQSYSLLNDSRYAEVSGYSSENNNIKADDACVLAGEHGFSLIPINGLWRQNKYIEHLSAQDINMHIDAAIKIGFTIVKSIGYTLYDCILPFLDDIRWLLDAGSQQYYRSFSVPIENSCTTRPIKIDKMLKVIEYCDYTPNEFVHLDKIKIRLGDLMKTIQSSI